MATRVTVTKKGDTFTVRSPGLGLRDKDFVFKTAKAAEARKVAEARVAELSEAYFDVERDWEETVFVSPVKRKTACQFQNAARLLGKKNVPGPVEQASLRRGDHALIAARKGNFWVRVTSTEKFKDASGPHASYRGVVIDRKASCEVGTEIAFVDANVAEVFKGKVAKRAPSQKKRNSTKKPWWKFW